MLIVHIMRLYAGEQGRLPRRSQNSLRQQGKKTALAFITGRRRGWGEHSCMWARARGACTFHQCQRGGARAFSPASWTWDSREGGAVGLESIQTSNTESDSDWPSNLLLTGSDSRAARCVSGRDEGPTAGSRLFPLPALHLGRKAGLSCPSGPTVFRHLAEFWQTARSSELHRATFPKAHGSNRKTSRREPRATLWAIAAQTACSLITQAS